MITLQDSKVLLHTMDLPELIDTATELTAYIKALHTEEDYTVPPENFESFNTLYQLRWRTDHEIEKFTEKLEKLAFV